VKLAYQDKDTDRVRALLDDDKVINV